ncbi:jg24172, partial [Pararge aegeria aegeria]
NYPGTNPNPKSYHQNGLERSPAEFCSESTRTVDTVDLEISVESFCDVLQYADDDRLEKTQ